MTKSRIGIAVIAAALLFAGANAQDTTPPVQPPAPRLVVGRYQLASVEHYVLIANHPPAPGEPGDRAVLRIDTATGNVDEWTTGIDANGNSVNRWVRTGTR